MNQGPVIAALCFTAFAVIVFVCLLFSKRPLFAGSLKKFFAAGTGVYISGTLLILLFACILKGVPLAFILISEFTIMTVFIVTFIIIIRLSKTLEKMSEENAKKHVQEEKAE